MGKNKNKNTPNIHDRFFRKSMSNALVAKNFFKTYLDPKILSLIDLDKIKFCNTSYIY
jgi:hypothetical protein